MQQFIQKNCGGPFEGQLSVKTWRDRFLRDVLQDAHLGGAMNTRLVPLLLLSACVSAQAEEQNNAVAAQVSDLATTYVALARGATELNPLGPGSLWITKPLVYQWIKSQPREMQPTYFSVGSAVGWGAAANNLCVIMTGGACALIGAVAGMVAWKQGAVEREYWDLCQRVRHREPADMSC